MYVVYAMTICSGIKCALTTVTRPSTAVCNRHRTVATSEFVSTALLRYGEHPYSAVFFTAVAVYGTVVTPKIQVREVLIESVPV